VKVLLAFLVTLALAGAARADVREVTLSPAEDLSLPFWCDWGYDWDERCFIDRSDRLGVGGVDDKVWRAALRFSLDALPPEATVVTAELSLAYDGTCVAPARRVRPCDGRGFDLVGRPIFSQQWQHEREVEYGPVVAYAELEPFAPPARLVADITDLVGDWHSGGVPNDGVLLSLAEDQEDFGSSGPAFPSSRHPDPSLRPRLTVWYLPDPG
jgi:hypothetical protein